MPTNPKHWTIAGWALTTLVLLFLAMDTTIKLLGVREVLETTAALGWPGTVGMARLLGIVLLVPALLYAVPRTAILGAILLTAYLGGAVATHVRIGNPLFSHTLFGVYVGVILWAGLWLRMPRLRALLAGTGETA
uniref:DoxX family protein n=1 Tax=uncultured Sphingomonas sp. TaxID=158754 RepID=UPI0035CB43D7